VWRLDKKFQEVLVDKTKREQTKPEYEVEYVDAYR